MKFTALLGIILFSLFARAAGDDLGLKTEYGCLLKNTLPETSLQATLTSGIIEGQFGLTIERKFMQQASSHAYPVKEAAQAENTTHVFRGAGAVLSVNVAAEADGTHTAVLQENFGQPVVLSCVAN